MVAYYFKVYVPSLGRRVSFREINIRDWININKSIINNDYGEVVECFDAIIRECCIESGILFTLLDKVVILLAIRAYSISNFCDIKIRDKDEDKEFEHKLELNGLLDSLLRLPIEHKKVVTVNEVTIEYGVPLYPVKDANVVSVADYIHCIKKNDQVLIDNTNSRDEMQEIVNNLDMEMFTEVTDYAKGLNRVFQENPLYVIRSPYNQTRELISQKMLLDFTMYDLLKMLFTENLHNLYRSIYTFNQQLNISPDYTERLIPVEKDLLWGYYIKDQRDAEAAKASKQKTGSFIP
jgi:hypothetical protein